MSNETYLKRPYMALNLSEIAGLNLGHMYPQSEKELSDFYRRFYGVHAWECYLADLQQYIPKQCVYLARQLTVNDLPLEERDAKLAELEELETLADRYMEPAGIGEAVRARVTGILTGLY